MSEIVEVRVARLEEQLKFLVKDAEEAKVSRKSQYESIEALSKAILTIASDMNEVKTKLAGQAPTIEEFITIKHKVVGAGKAGKVVWASGAFIIGIVYNLTTIMKLKTQVFQLSRKIEKQETIKNNKQTDQII